MHIYTEVSYGHGSTPKSSKSVDSVRIEIDGDLGICCLRNTPV